MMRTKTLRYCLAILVAALLTPATKAGPIRDRLIERAQARREAATPAKTDLARQTVSYGADQRQSFDVYLPSTKSSGAPVIFMVHGGGWAYGDKNMSRVVDNKTARWVTKGIVFVSVNYRMLPEADPYMQAEDVARALAKAQEQAASWGADRNRFVLMGHSAGAHLVALLASSPALLQHVGATAPVGTVSLDSATLDVVQTMEGKHMSLHDRAFGTDHAFWVKTSPWHALTARPAPILAVCSTRRADACPQAVRFSDKVKSLGGSSAVLRENLTHSDINETLGQPNAYTETVEAFLGRLDPSLAERFSQ